MREQARGDGTDIRGIIVPGLLISCLLAPLGLSRRRFDRPRQRAGPGRRRPGGRGRFFRHRPGPAARAAAGLHGDEGDDRPRGAGFGPRHRGLDRGPIGRASCWCRRRSPICSRRWPSPATCGAERPFATTAARLFELAKAGIPLTASLTLLALSSVIDRFIIAHLIGPAAAGPVQRRRRPRSAVA